ncbi:MAG: NPCBM/NEW2 domain-containing protein [Gemmataceae bacterium]
MPVAAGDWVTLDGKRSAGTIAAVGPDAVTFQGKDGGKAVVPLKQLAAVELRDLPPPAADAKFDELELTDGSVVRAATVRIKGKKVEVEPPSGADPPAVELPLSAVFWLMRNAHDPKARDDWKKLVAARGKRDAFVIRQSAGGLTPLTGTLIEGSAAGDRVTFEREDGQRSNLPLTRATGGLLFNQPATDAVPPTLCKVLDVFGNVWFAKSVEVAGPGLKVATVAGAVVTYKTLAPVAKLDFTQGNLTYLSDLAFTADLPPPTEADGPRGEWAAYQPKVGKDRSVDHARFGPIQMAGKRFAKGIAVPPQATVAVPLDAGYREFRATVGLHELARAEYANLAVRIEVDGRPVFSATLTKADPPKELSVSVKDAKALRIVVEGPPLLGNQVCFGDARLLK